MPTIHHRASRERVGTRSVPTLRATILRQTAGAAGTRSSLRPLFSRRVNQDANLGRNASREREVILHRHRPPCVQLRTGADDPVSQRRQ